MTEGIGELILPNLFLEEVAENQSLEDRYRQDLLQVSYEVLLENLWAVRWPHCYKDPRPDSFQQPLRIIKTV